MRRVWVLIKNILSWPGRLFTRIALLAVLQEAQVDKRAAIGSGAKFYRSSIGRYSYVSRNCFVTDATIGSFTSIAADCYIGGTPHTMEWVSTSPVFHKWGNVLKRNFSHHEFDIFIRTMIGSDVWIGTGAMIRAGVTIGDGAVIGMGSVLTKDVGPYEIWAGNPARFIRKRFDDETVERLLKSRWWEAEEARIEEFAVYVTDPAAFLEHLENRV